MVMIDHYVQDNDRAHREGVIIPPRPTPTTTTTTSSIEGTTVPPPSPPLLLLRTLQWNIQVFTSATRVRDDDNTRGMLDTINATDADVIVLNECGSFGRHHTRHHTMLRKALENGGYTFRDIGSVCFPTMVATKWPVSDYRELILSKERSALCLKIVYNDHNDDTEDAADTEDATYTINKQRYVWIVGTHLDAFCGFQRRQETVRLLQGLESLLRDGDNTDMDDDGNNIPIILVGDLNQQRSVDYSTEEWKRIQKSMDGRGVCHDDGVADQLNQFGFHCVFDQVRAGRVQQQQLQEKQHGPSLPPAPPHGVVHCNWETLEPPSTHWSGTAIDYSYSKNVVPHGIYVSPAGFSDHRMVVCDWNLPSTQGVAGKGSRCPRERQDDGVPLLAHCYWSKPSSDNP